MYFRLPENERKLTLIIESIYSIDAGTLVVASKEKEVLRMLDLIS